MSVCPLKGVNVAAVVGIALKKLGVPRGVAVVVEDEIVVEMIFGDDTAALDAMLLKKESYPMWYPARNTVLRSPNSFPNAPDVQTGEYAMPRTGAKLLRSFEI